MILYFNRFYFSIIKCKEYVRLRSYEIINIKIYLILLFWFSVRLVSYFLNMNKKLVAWLCVIFPLWIYLLALFCYHCDFVLSFAQDLSRYYILSFWYYILSRRCSKLCSGLCCEIIFCLLDIYIISTSALHHIRQSRFYCFTCNKNRTSVWHSLGCVTWILYFIEALFEALL